ncbi:MAG: dephospho-CoA kinase [Actinomycetota bacterium]|nr:dephospho-CoA kinase [Actinomycetota bacterium]
MLVVGLTGGIGSGKSSLAAELTALGVPVVDSDEVARRCVEPGAPALAAIVDRFGTEILAPDGSLDRAALAALVFVDADARRDLEAITHPCIRAGVDADLEALRVRADRPSVAVVEHPLLVETGGHARVDVVVVVEAPTEDRIARLVRARGMTEAAARDRMAAQADDATRRAVADHVVVNDGDRDALASHAARLLAVLQAAADVAKASDAADSADGAPETGEPR